MAGNKVLQVVVVGDGNHPRSEAVARAIFREATEGPRAASFVGLEVACVFLADAARVDELLRERRGGEVIALLCDVPSLGRGRRYSPFGPDAARAKAPAWAAGIETGVLISSDLEDGHVLSCARHLAIGFRNACAKRTTWPWGRYPASDTGVRQGSRDSYGLVGMVYA